MKQNNAIIKKILDRLTHLDVASVILFGSYAQGTANETSDLDLVVVLNRIDVPKTYEEKMNLRLHVRKQIQSLCGKLPVDLLVYTKTEYAAFIQRNSSFAREIQETGQVVYEKTG